MCVVAVGVGVGRGGGHGGERDDPGVTSAPRLDVSDQTGRLKGEGEGG